MKKHIPSSIKLWILALLPCTFASSVLSQQTPLFNTYVVNKFLVNPAFVGIDNEYRAFGTFRSQWGDMPGRPLTGAATLEGSFWKDRIGAGLYIVNDHIGIFNQTEIDLAYAQKIALGKEQQLSIGVQGGVIANQIDFNSATVKDVNDPGLALQRATSEVFDLSAGVSYKWRTLIIGLALPNLIQPNANYDVTGGTGTRYLYLRQYTAFAQYRIGIANGKFGITPTVVMRKTTQSEFQLDGTALFDYKSLVFAGGGYRTSYGVIAIAGVNILNMFTVAYSYDHVTEPVISGQTGGSHEITFGFHIASNYRHKKMEQPTPIILQDSAMNESLRKQNDSLNARMTATKQALDSMNRIANKLGIIVNKEIEKADSLSGLVEETTALKSVTIAKGSDENSFTLDKIYFNFNDYTLLPQSRPQLDSLAAFLKQHPNIDIHVNGYSDNIGGKDFNQKLSEQRAKAVVDYLILSGIDASRLSYVGKGSDNPIADNRTEEGRKQNRRVEFVIIKK